MSLTKGSGPFGAAPAGSFNFDPHAPEHVLYVERSLRRVRVLLGGKTMADSTDVRLLHPPARTPTYLFPPEHVATELFEPSDRRRSDPAMGEGTYWTVQVGDRRAVDAAYSFEQPPESAAAVAGLVDALRERPPRALLPAGRGRTHGSSHPSYYWSLRDDERFERNIVWTYP